MSEFDTLVMLSGGIDSTAALWHVLHNKDKYGKVHVHHIHIHNIEGRWRAEARAVKQILEYLKENAKLNFTSSDSVMAIPNVGNHFLFDVEVIGFITGYMTSRAPGISKVVIGMTRTDLGQSTLPGTITKSKTMHNAFHTEIDDHSQTVKDFPLKAMTKQEAYDSMPVELARMTWSCRRPRRLADGFMECGKCKTCRGEMRGVDRYGKRR